MDHWNTNQKNADLVKAKALKMMHRKHYETEWQGTTITLIRTSTHYELLVNGKSQDFISGYSSSNDFILYGQNGEGDQIKIKLERTREMFFRFLFYFNGKEIYSAETKSL